MKDQLIRYLLDKIVPGLLTGILIIAVNTYIDVKILKRDFAQFQVQYYDLLEQINNQLQKKN